MLRNKYEEFMKMYLQFFSALLACLLIEAQAFLFYNLVNKKNLINLFYQV